MPLPLGAADLGIGRSARGAKIGGLMADRTHRLDEKLTERRYEEEILYNLAISPEGI